MALSNGTPKQQITGVVLRLYAQYPAQNMAAQLYSEKIGDMVAALMEFEPAAVEAAAIRWWTDPENKWPPHPGALIEVCRSTQGRLIQDRAVTKERLHQEQKLLAAPVPQEVVDFQQRKERVQV